MHQEIIGFHTSAFQDYKVSRFLLNNGFIFHGATLASTSIEKYFKCVLLTHNIRKRIHLDKLNIFKEELNKIGYGIIFEKIDPVFLEALSKIYTYRYADSTTVKEPDTVGFLVNQFICELDYAVWFLNKALIIKKNDDPEYEPIYIREMRQRSPELVQNNFIFENVSKKDFMERPSDAFAIHLNPKFLGSEIEITGKNIKVDYTGNIWKILVTNK